MYANVIMQCIK